MKLKNSGNSLVVFTNYNWFLVPFLMAAIYKFEFNLISIFIIIFIVGIISFRGRVTFDFDNQIIECTYFVFFVDWYDSIYKIEDIKKIKLKFKRFIGGALTFTPYQLVIELKKGKSIDILGSHTDEKLKKIEIEVNARYKFEESP
ncbi:MAG: hypothetical protein SFU91_13335 [Chloroherpetonaceae bacterium]|nr:hypothetical protein [Chloroherpetonaceae bacterium]